MFSIDRCRIAIVLFVLLCVLLERSEGRRPRRPKRPRRKPQCKGTLENLIIDFEVDNRGQPLRVGQTPRRLPGGIKVTGIRKGGQPQGRRSPLAIFDTSNPTRFDKDLGTTTEGNVLIINQSNNKRLPNDNAWGGFIFFNFARPVYQINSVRFLDVQSPKGFIQARRRRRNRPGMVQTPRVSIPRNKNRAIFTVDLDHNFRLVKTLRIKLTRSGAVSALNVTVCKPRGSGPVSPPTPGPSLPETSAPSMAPSTSAPVTLQPSSPPPTPEPTPEATMAPSTAAPVTLQPSTPAPTPEPTPSR